MSEQVAIVAGAGGELGPATAKKLPAAAVTMVGADRNEEALKELRTASGARRPTRPTRPRPAASSTGSPPRPARPGCW
jgi:NADP-dependent 3-hydroxy acid dehydrogenase YdfG